MHIVSSIRATAVVVALLTGTVYAQSNNDSMSASSPTVTDKGAIRLANRHTARSVRHALTATNGLISANITILVKGGVVTLVGTVPDDSQIRLAETAAKTVPNVQSVSNRLIVEEEGGG
jgi:hyperosmotically inducible protein